jgi:hypothetical protein
LRTQATTGLPEDVFGELVDLMAAQLGGWNPHRGRPRALPLPQAVRLVVFLLRHNLTQAAAAEVYDISQASVSRLYNRLMPTISLVLADLLPSLAARTGRVLLVDGTFVPTFNWKAVEDLYSGKHHDHGANVQVVADTAGRTVAVAPPLPGARHDSRAFTDTGLADLLIDVPVLADTGYLGHDQLHTPLRKQPGRDRTGADKRAASSIATIRWAVEQAIAHLKNWKILSTRYRGPWHKLSTVIHAVASLELFLTWA